MRTIILSPVRVPSPVKRDRGRRIEVLEDAPHRARIVDQGDQAHLLSNALAS